MYVVFFFIYLLIYYVFQKGFNVGWMTATTRLLNLIRERKGVPKINKNMIIVRIRVKMFTLSFVYFWSLNLEVPKKIKNRTTIQSSNSTLGIYPKKTKALIQKDTCTPVFIVIYNSQGMEATWVSISRWRIKKMWYIYTLEYYSVIKKNEILPFATAWIDLEGIMLIETSQT